jgi:hypothetical protein
MRTSVPNEHGVLNIGHEEIVARHGRSQAIVRLALCEDGLYRQATSIHYSYGGFGGPIWLDCPGYATVAEARTAGLEELLRRWPTAWPSEPQSVHDELAELRRQVEAQLLQPSLF